MLALVSRAYSAAYKNASVIQGSIRFRAHSSGFVVMLAAFFIVIANLVVDILYAVLDPRVRF